MGKSHTTSPYKQGLEKGQGRNEVSPFKGIDTSSFVSVFCFFRSRNEVSPFKGIDTHIIDTIIEESFFRRNEVSPFKGIDTL